jgi:hypothetical protein
VGLRGGGGGREREQDDAATQGAPGHVEFFLFILIFFNQYLKNNRAKKKFQTF